MSRKHLLICLLQSLKPKIQYHLHEHIRKQYKNNNPRYIKCRKRCPKHKCCTFISCLSEKKSEILIFRKKENRNINNQKLQIQKGKLSTNLALE